MNNVIVHSRTISHFVEMQIFPEHDLIHFAVADGVAWHIVFCIFISIP